MDPRIGLLLTLAAAAPAEPDPAPVPISELERQLENPDRRDDVAVALLRRAPAHPRAQEIVIAQLRHEEWYTRWRACLTLARIGKACSRRAVAELAAAAIDSSRDVQREASVALARIAPTSPAALRFWDYRCRRGGADVPEGVHGPLRAWRERRARMRATPPRLRPGRLFALRDFGFRDADVLRALCSDDPAVLTAALREIGERDHLDPRTYVPLVAEVMHRSVPARWVARAVLVDRHAKHFARLLYWPQRNSDVVKLLKDKDPTHRRTAVLLVPHVRPGPDLWRRFDAVLLFDPDERVRAAAMDALFTAADLRLRRR